MFLKSVVSNCTTRCDTVHHEARRGSRAGMATGSACGVAIVVYGVMREVLEKMYRGAGYQPSWLLSIEECNLPQFNTLSICMNKFSFESYSYLLGLSAGAIVLSATCIGAVVGAVKGLCKQRIIARVNNGAS